MSITYPGSLITKTPVTPVDGVASGIWTLSEQAYWQAQNAWTAQSDPNFENVTLLLNGDGTNGAQNNTFLDSSTNNFTITRNGNTTQGSFSPYGSNWSNYFDGAGDYFLLADNAAWTTSSAYTIECWYNPSVLSASFGTLVGYSAPTATAWILNVQPDGKVLFRWYNTSVTEFNLTSSAAISVGTWNHIAVTISGTTATIWINGSQSGTLTLSGSPRTITSGQLGIGSWGAASSQPTANGYISNVRIIKGTAVYSGSTITVPTAPLTAITNTVLLTCQSNRFVDNSTNNFTLTVNGTPSVQRFSPFNPTAPYSTSVIGGSGYFDGTGDNLKVPAGSAFAYGTGNFTIEGWFYVTVALPQYGRNLFAQTASGTTYLLCTLSDGTANNPPANKVQFSTQTMGALSGATTFALNTWNHFAVVRNSGSVTVYLNGVGGTPVASTDNFTNTTYVPTIGNWTHDSTNQTFIGHLSDFRVTKSAVYTSNFTPNTAPLTNIANTSLLTNMSNAGIPDLAMQNNLETVGNAQVSTSVKKYGTGSLAFDGTGDYLISTANTSLYTFGAGAFTIEFWVYFNSISGNPQMIAFNPTSTNGAYPLIYIGSTNKFAYYVNNTEVITGSTTPSTSVWYHVAICRSGTSTRLFVNGTQEGSTYSDSNNYLCGTNRPVIGSGGFNLLNPLNGNIDDLRITKGVARYTASFTPRASAFPKF